MDFAPLVVALALVWKLVDFAKACRVRDIDAIVSQLAVWVAGVIVIFLLAATDFASGVKIGSLNLDALNAASLVLLGLSIGSTGSVAYDFKRAFDGSDSAAQPSLVTGLVPAPPVDVVTPPAPPQELAAPPPTKRHTATPRV